MADKDNQQTRDTETRRILERVSNESASGSLASRTKGHFSAHDADSNDPIEVWGTRIGRFLGLLVLIAMFIWLMISIFGLG